jgi:undecaprenyl-diphosphatase
MDTQLFFLINHGMANPLFDVLMPALTHQGYLLAIPLALFVLYSGIRQGTSGDRPYASAAFAAVIIAILAVPLADALCSLLKTSLMRPRPCQALEGVRLLVTCSSSFSLPSSHATTSFAFSVPLALLTRPFLPLAWRLAPLLLALAIAFSRPYLGVHYPSDVVAGALLGTAVAGAMCWGYRMISKRTNGKDESNPMNYNL